MSPVVDGVVRVERSLSATPEQVWRAFTDPLAMAAWMWAGIGDNPRATSDVRPGGRYRVVIDDSPGKDGWASGERAFEGTYAVVEAPARLVYTVHWDAPVGYNQTGAAVPDEVVEVVIEPLAGSTVVRMAHMGIPDDAISLIAHDRGIEAMFDSLEESFLVEE
jgi:uncharacterized protein YndB with AHSA1/START domain